MGFLTNLLGSAAFRRLPPELQPLYRSFAGEGVQPTSAPYLLVEAIVAPLRDHAIPAHTAAAVVTDTLRALRRSGYRMAASTDDARVGFLARHEAEAAARLSSRVLPRCTIEHDLALVAEGALAMYAGTRRSRPSIDLERSGVRALRDLSLAEGLLTIGAPALRQRSTSIDHVETALDASIFGDVATYVSLVPEPGLALADGPVQLFGPRAMAETYKGGLMRSSSGACLPIATAGSFVIGIDVLGVHGTAGTVLASHFGSVARLASSLTALLDGLVKGTVQKNLAAAAFGRATS